METLVIGYKSDGISWIARSSPSNALQAASCEGHEKVIELLLRKGAEVDARSREYVKA